MIGLETVMAYRLAGGEIGRLWLEIDPAKPQPAGVWMLDGTVQALLVAEGKDTAPRCDLRVAAGLHVAVAARDWRRAWPFVDALSEHRPASLSLIADDMAAHWTPEKGLQAWDL